MMADDFGRSPDGSGSRASTEPVCAVSAVPASIPSATQREWDNLDVGEPHHAWIAAAKRFHDEAIREEQIVAKLMRDAADMERQAAIHADRADSFDAMSRAIFNAPITFASGIAARSDETAQQAHPERQEPGPKGDAQGQSHEGS